MGYVTEHFNVEEFDCKDGTSYPHNWIETKLKNLCKQLEVLRESLGNRKITILSGYRSPEHNKKVGGAKQSYHIQGIAADIRVEGIKPRVVAERIASLIKDGKMYPGGLGDYSSWTHYDCRGKNVRWKNR